jgi:hypothetical protein
MRYSRAWIGPGVNDIACARARPSTLRERFTVLGVLGAILWWYGVLNWGAGMQSYFYSAACVCMCSAPSILLFWGK